MKRKTGLMPMCVIIGCLVLSGCEGKPGIMGEQGIPGESAEIERWTHVINESEVEWSEGLNAFTVTISDYRIELGYEYKLSYWLDEGGWLALDMMLDSYSQSYYFAVVVLEGGLIFSTDQTEMIGRTIRITKY